MQSAAEADESSKVSPCNFVLFSSQIHNDHGEENSWTFSLLSFISLGKSLAWRDVAFFSSRCGCENFDADCVATAATASGSVRAAKIVGYIFFLLAPPFKKNSTEVKWDRKKKSCYCSEIIFQIFRIVLTGFDGSLWKLKCMELTSLDALLRVFTL